jgi:hypothetical protein
VNIGLQVASVNATVTVEANAQIIDQNAISNSVTLNSNSVENLPIRGRNFQEFALLAPNVMQEQDRFGMVVNGQRSSNSNVSLDGTDFNDSLQGGQRGNNDGAAYWFPQSAVREFQFVRTGASAEVGRTNAGFLNVVTKSGTNTYHGEAFYQNRNGSLTSPDAFNNPSTNNSQHQFGGSIGGPILKDKLFFFASVEKNKVQIPYMVKFTPQVASIVIPQSILEQQGDFYNTNNPLVSFGRADYILNSKNTLNLQYTYSVLNGGNFKGPSSQTTSASSNNKYLDRSSQGIKAAVTTVFASTLLNEMRGQFAYDNRNEDSVVQMPQIDITGFGTLGGNSDGHIFYYAKRYEILDNVSWNRGAHTLKFGVDLNWNPQQQARETNGGGDYSFNSIGDYLAGKINQYQQAIAANGGQGVYRGMQQDHAAFIQDTIQLRRDFTLTMGLRWEGEIEPQPKRPNPRFPVLTGQIPNDLTMWQPRLGFAYNVAGNTKSVIRASAGLFDARTPAYLLQRVFTDNGIDTTIIDTSVDPNAFNYLHFPNALTSVPAGVSQPINSVYALDPAFKNPRSGQVAVSFEQQLDQQTTATISFVRNSTWGLQRRIDTNLYPPTIDAAGNAVYPVGPKSTAGVLRPDPTVGQINVNQSTAHSDYNSLSISVQRRMSRRLQFQAHYTYSTTRDDDSNERDFNRQTAFDTYNLSLDATYSKQDIRHNGNLNAVYSLPWGVTATGIFMARTGQPWKAVVGSDTQNDSNTVNDLPVFNGHVIPRNSFRLPGFLDFDARLLKSIKLPKLGERARLNLSAEAYNITRSTNKNLSSNGESKSGKALANGALNPFTGWPFATNSFSIPTNAPATDRFGGPRQVQLGARFVF